MFPSVSLRFSPSSSSPSSFFFFPCFRSGKQSTFAALCSTAGDALVTIIGRPKSFIRARFVLPLLWALSFSLSAAPAVLLLGRPWPLSLSPLDAQLPAAPGRVMAAHGAAIGRPARTHAQPWLAVQKLYTHTRSIYIYIYIYV